MAAHRSIVGVAGALLGPRAVIELAAPDMELLGPSVLDEPDMELLGPLVAIGAAVELVPGPELAGRVGAAQVSSSSSSSKAATGIAAEGWGPRGSRLSSSASCCGC